MPLLFIDANVYLSCFSGEGSSIADLLESVADQAARTLVTEQVVLEVQRNKSRLVGEFFANYANQIAKASKVVIPVQFIESDADRKSLEDWKLKTQVWQAQAREFHGFLEQLRERTISSVVRSADPVSQRLSTIFRGAVPATPRQVGAARERKERGNPPGKQTDPLGDQITWEQVLGEQERWRDGLWVISRDEDFFASSEASELNPVLYDELRARLGIDPTVYCFRSLSDGLKHFVKHSGTPVVNLPDEVTLANAKDAEQRLDSQLPHYPAVVVGTMAPDGRATTVVVTPSPSGELSYRVTPFGVNFGSHFDAPWSVNLNPTRDLERAAADALRSVNLNPARDLERATADAVRSVDLNPARDLERAAADAGRSVDLNPARDLERAAADAVRSVNLNPARDLERAAADAVRSVNLNPARDLERAAADALRSVNLNPARDLERAAADAVRSVNLNPARDLERAAADALRSVNLNPSRDPERAAADEDPANREDQSPPEPDVGEGD